MKKILILFLFTTLLIPSIFASETMDNKYESEFHNNYNKSEHKNDSFRVYGYNVIMKSKTFYTNSVSRLKNRRHKKRIEAGNNTISD